MVKGGRTGSAWAKYDGQLLEPVRRHRRRHLLLTLHAMAIRSVDSNTIDELMYVTFLQRPSWHVRNDRRITCRSGDPLVLGEQVVGMGVEVRDATDAGSSGDEVVAVVEQHACASGRHR